MDKDHAARIAAIAARAEQIKSNSAEYLWVCRGIKPLPLPDKPVATNAGATAHANAAAELQMQLRLSSHAAPVTKLQRP